MKKYIFIAVLVLNYVCLFSAYFNNVPVNLKQANGSIIHAYVSGDEYSYRIHDENKYTLLLNPASGDYVYAQRSGDKVIPGLVPAGKSSPVGLEKNLPVKRYLSLEKRNNKLFHRSPNHGTLANIVVFIKFQNDPDFTQAVSLYNSWFSDENEASLKGYYEEASYGKLTIDSHFLPTQNSEQVVAYTDSHVRDYYRPYSVDNTIGYADEDTGFARLHECLRNAIVSVNSQLPGDINLDGDLDGVVDNVCFIVSGDTDNWADVLWPHMWELETSTAYLQNKMVKNYNLQIENFLAYSGRDVSVLCHEMFHSIGAPDLYHYNHDYEPIGYWDLMEWDAKQHMTAYMKFRYGNWISDVPVITQSGTYSLKPLKEGGNCIYKVYSPNSTNQYFVLEYRKQEGLYESALPGSGLLAYRVNTNYIGYGNRDGILGGLYNELLAYRPMGSVTEIGDINNAFLSLESGRTVIGDNSIISPFLENGMMGGLNISNVGSAGDSITFDIQIQGDIHPKYPPRNLRGTLVYPNHVNLTWDKPLDITGLLGFMIYKDGATPITSLMSDTTFTDANVTEGPFGDLHYYVVIAVYSGNNISEMSNLLTITVVPQVSADDIVSLSKTELTGNYPNPFNPTTTIAFTLDKTQDIEMDIFNIKGQRVKKLIKKDSYSSGNHNIIWNGQNDSSEICPSGIYFYRLKTANKTFTGKMLMLK